MALSEHEVWAGGGVTAPKINRKTIGPTGGGFHMRQLYGVNRKVNSPGKHPLLLFTRGLAAMYAASDRLTA